jgi:glycolate oxidase FAD binding subunit
LLIGVGLATIDGRVVRAGGHVVKNVAGYDLGKLVTGSFGSLAAIVEATFKLAPRPFASATAVAEFTDIQSVDDAVAAIASSQLEPVAFDLMADRPHDGPLRATLLVRFSSTPRAVDAQIVRVSALIGERASTTVLRDLPEIECWRRHERDLWRAESVMKTSWRPGQTAAVLRTLDHAAGAAGARVRLAGRAARGAGLIAVDASSGGQVDVATALRAASVFGPVAVLKADRAVKEHLDVWGPSHDAATAFLAVKRAFDPAAILGAGRGPV